MSEDAGVAEARLTLEERLAALDVPVAHRLALHDPNPLSRLHASPLAHRLLPTGVAVVLAALRGRAEYALLPRRRRAALEEAEGLAPPEGLDRRRLARLARVHLSERTVQTELSWRPWAARAMPVHGLEHLDAARAGERGTILAALHAGPMLNLVYALAARGHTVHVAGGHRLTEPPLRGHHGRWIKTQNVWVEEAGCRWVRRPGAFGVLRVVLERGGIAWVNVDAGGGTPGRLLGRTLRTRGGAAALARATNALVIPAGVLRERFGQAAFLLPAIDPGDVASEDELTRRIWEALDPVMRPRRAQAHADLARHLAAGGGAA